MHTVHVWDVSLDATAKLGLSGLWACEVSGQTERCVHTKETERRMHTAKFIVWAFGEAAFLLSHAHTAIQKNTSEQKL